MPQYVVCLSVGMGPPVCDKDRWAHAVFGHGIRKDLKSFFLGVVADGGQSQQQTCRCCYLFY